MNKRLLSTRIGRMLLKNPVIGASGTFGYGIEYERFFPLERIGGFVTKGLSLRPRRGNPAPRIKETPCGLINSIGLENIGMDAFLRSVLPRLEGTDTAVIVNIFGTTVDEYVELAERVDRFRRIDGIELNISCPNVEAGGAEFGKDPLVVHAVTSKVREATDKTLIVKLSPMVTSIVDVALSAQSAGADAVSIANTYPAMAFDLESGGPSLGAKTGGLSGPAIKPMTLKLVYDAYARVRIPIIGVGGIITVEDVVEYAIAGASAVQVGTASFINPETADTLVRQLEEYLSARGVQRFRALVGSAKERCPSSV
ncbi:MAG: dihydroorotate dehydrogenase [Deltaproteobacteria bacterium]|nr:dihydroorotate dehydrogenase [Deltaproteobacteria bacterium]MCL5277973.1 dihydroorotate dehydrogenase [Deltaproteobacteria bacterium]